MKQRLSYIYCMVLDVSGFLSFNDSIPVSQIFLDLHILFNQV